MDIKECVESGLLKASQKDIRKAKRSLEVSKNKLNKAIRLKESKFYEDAAVNAYSSMFHAGRALLFADGFVEKSHYGLYVYLREKYGNKIEPRFINELDSLRLERHEILYSLETIVMNPGETEEIISIARDFLRAVEKLLES